MIDGLRPDRRGSRGRALRVAPGPRRRDPHRPAPDARLQPAAAHRGRRQPRLRHRDERRLGRRVPRAPRREPPPRDGPRALHRDRRARRRRSSRSSSPSTSSSSCSPRSSCMSRVTMARGRDPAPESVERPRTAAAADAPADVAADSSFVAALSGPGYRVRRPGLRGGRERRRRQSRRPCSGSAAGSSRCRSCTSSWACRSASRRRRAT